ncbi:EF-hand domain-containing protein [Marinimicrobium sp. ARAG 43.8]|uniref:EF-hand domain-containing protein n=1 Tax=Marinimicrobium sp. ARAG 43.8 TaxID=3418719 RepID=UPI003CEE5AE1
MKTLSVIAASALLSLGSLSVVAQDTTRENQGAQPQGTGTGSAFSVIDQDGNGSISKEEAKNSGISDSRFKSMDRNGDGKVSQSEYQQ